MVNLIDKPENPAKVFLKRYRAAVYRIHSLERAIDEANERATNITMRIKPISVQNGSAVYDRMAEDACKVVDATEQLWNEKEKANAVLTEVLQAINSVQDEMQKTVLTLRYVEGLGWTDIQEKISYERTQTLVIHGRALWAVNQWMKGRTI